MITRNDAIELVALTCATLDVPDLAKKISVSFNARFTARMGDATYNAKTGTGRVRLSAPLWPKANRDEQIETVIHEACHVVVIFKHGRVSAHGAEWIAMMTKCGYPNPGRCHTVDKENIAARRRQNRFKIQCGCAEGGSVGPVWARRIRQGVKAKCTKCGHFVALKTEG